MRKAELEKAVTLRLTKKKPADTDMAIMGFLYDRRGSGRTLQQVVRAAGKTEGHVLEVLERLEVEWKIRKEPYIVQGGFNYGECFYKYCIMPKKMWQVSMDKTQHYMRKILLPGVQRPMEKLLKNQKIPAEERQIIAETLVNHEREQIRRTIKNQAKTRHDVEVGGTGGV